MLPTELPALYGFDQTANPPHVYRHTLVELCGVWYIITALRNGWSVWILDVWNDPQKRKEKGVMCELMMPMSWYKTVEASNDAAVMWLARYLDHPVDRITTLEVLP